MKLWKDRVLDLRSLLGITQAELASILEASVQLVKAWEKRATKPYSPVAERFRLLEQSAEEEYGLRKLEASRR